ncbi:hypothetical protein GB848_19545 [Salmonella enterica]|uniref:Uncharacterized protein n=1 Tax=Salmonella enterica TaxID=28901 RepID=A0A628V700_SALER|nr:hypothetical protein [Salmonella enterica]
MKYKEVGCGNTGLVDESNKPVSGLKVQLEYHQLATAAELTLRQAYCFARSGKMRRQHSSLCPGIFHALLSERSAILCQISCRRISVIHN